ncbi:MAG: hypothetical protein R3B49_03630 [Phycisphaerales bacterium]
MIRAQQARHARTWLVLGPALIAAVVALWLARPPGPGGDAPAGQGALP